MSINNSTMQDFKSNHWLVNHLITSYRPQKTEKAFETHLRQRSLPMSFQYSSKQRPLLRSKMMHKPFILKTSRMEESLKAGQLPMVLSTLQGRKHLFEQTVPSRCRRRLTAVIGGTNKLVHFDHRHETDIRAGENAGRTLAYRHVVRDIKHLGDWRGENRRIAWPPRTGYGIALLVQHRGDGTILASIAHMQ